MLGLKLYIPDKRNLHVFIGGEKYKSRQFSSEEL